MALLAIFGDILFIVVPGNVGCNHNIVVIFIPFFGLHLSTYRKIILKDAKSTEGKNELYKTVSETGSSCSIFKK